LKIDEAKVKLKDVIDQLVNSKIDANRRYIDEILDKIQYQNRTYFLDQMKAEIDQMASAIEKGDLKRASQHKVLAETYKAIVERCF